MCARSEWPLWRDKRPFEGARTDGRTGRLSDRHRGLRLQCSRRHVAWIPFHLHNSSTSCPSAHTNTPNHDAAHGDGWMDGFKGRIGVLRGRDWAVSQWQLLSNSPWPYLYINIFGLVYLQIQMPKADKSTETGRQKYKLCGWEKETPWSW